jgi:hypothetical protein
LLLYRAKAKPEAHRLSACADTLPAKTTRSTRCFPDRCGLLKTTTFQSATSPATSRAVSDAMANCSGQRSHCRGTSREAFEDQIGWDLAAFFESEERALSESALNSEGAVPRPGYPMDGGAAMSAKRK